MTANPNRSKRKALPFFSNLTFRFPCYQRRLAEISGSKSEFGLKTAGNLNYFFITFNGLRIFSGSGVL